MKTSEKLAEELLSLYSMEPDHVDAPNPDIKALSQLIEKYYPDEKYSKKMD